MTFREERIGDCRLILGDCLEVMRSWPTCFRVPALVTDPPYGIGEGNERGQSRENAARPIEYAGTDGWDRKTADEAVAHAVSISRHSIIFGGNYYSLPPTSCWLVWDKQNSGDFADCELAWTNLPKAVRRIYWRWNGMIRRGDDVRVHPTQKPVGVITWCIEHLPNAADTIFDPFAGSGTIGVAAVRMGRRFIGIERDPEYFRTMCERIDAATKEPKDLFIAPPSPPKQETLDL